MANNGLAVVRAEIASASDFTLLVEGARSPALLDEVIVALELACGTGTAIRLQLRSANQCRLEARWYLQLDRSLRAMGGPFRWAPLPGWVVAALPGFGGTDTALRALPAVWLPEGLIEYQKTAVRRAVVQGGRVLLADEMGLGKTVQALAVMAQYLDEEGPALVVTPSSLGGVWKEQALRWLPQLRPSEVQVVRGLQDRPLPQARIVIVSYAIFVKEAKGFSHTSRSTPWQIVACDEAHYLRNPTSQRGKALIPVLQNARRCILVTGTPAPKQASEAFSLLHSLRPLDCSFQEWCGRYGSERTESREAEVAALLSEVMVRRTKADVLDQLPPKHRQRICLHLPSGKAGMLKKLQRETEAPTSDEEYFRQLAHVKEMAAQDYTEYLLDASGQKFLLFAHHISMLGALENTVKKRGVDFIRIDGSTPVSERMGLVRRFQGEPSCRVAVLQVVSAGEGLTLTAATICVFCELCPAVPGVIEQAEARIHRIGQQASKVDVHFLVVDGTRDDRVFTRLEARTGAVARAVGDAAAPVAAEPAVPPGPHDPVTDFGALFEKPAQDVERAASAPGRAAQAAAGEGACGPQRKKRKPGYNLESLLSASISQLQAELTEPKLPEASDNSHAGRGKVDAVPHPTQQGAAAARTTGGQRSTRGRASRKAQRAPCNAAAGAAVTTSHVPAPVEPAGRLAAAARAPPAKARSSRRVTAPTPLVAPAEEEDPMDAALSFFASDTRTSAAVTVPFTEGANSPDGKRRDSQEINHSGNDLFRDDWIYRADETRPGAAFAASAPEPAPLESPGSEEEPLSSLLGSLIDSARVGSF